MKTFAVLIVLAAWGSAWAWRGDGARLLQLLLFGAVGTLMTLAGAFSLWWDSGMRPGQASSLLLGCGLLTLLPQLPTLLRGFLEGEGGTDWPRRR